MRERASRPVGRAELATRRVLAIGAGVIALVATVTVIRLMVREGDESLPGWFFVLSLTVVAVFVGTALCSAYVGARVIRIGAAASAVGYVLILAAFLPAAVEAHELARMPWMLSAAGAAVVSAVLAVGRKGGWVVLGCAGIAGLFYRVWIGGLDLDGVVNDAQAALTGTIVVVVCAFILSVSARLDSAAAVAADATARASAEQGKLAARSKAAALVHDEVLATLSLAGKGVVSQQLLAPQAGVAVKMVHHLTDERELTPSPLSDALRAEAQRVGAQFRLIPGAHTDDGSVGMVDQKLHHALVAASRQALENSAVHAPFATEHILELTQEEDHIVVEVIDDGVGFDPEAVPADRLGIRASIVGRMREIAGGRAFILSSPGAGTRVRLEWVAPTGTAPVVESEPGSDAGIDADAATLRAGIRVVIAVFVAAQVICAVAAALVGPIWWVPLVLGVAVVGAASVAQATSSLHEHRQSVFVLTMVIVTTGAGLAMVPFTFGTTWFVSSAGFLLFALVLRGRPLMAVIGLAVVSGMVLVAGAMAGATAPTVGFVILRPIVVVAMTCALVGAVAHMQRRTKVFHRRAVATAEKAAWDAATRSELAVHARDLSRRVVPLLQRVAEASALRDDEKSACLALEGALRDDYRAGALNREPLMTAVGAARARGVDVVLLDDRDAALGDEISAAVSVWMADAVGDGKRRISARLHPVGRDHIATITVDGHTQDFLG